MTHDEMLLKVHLLRKDNDASNWIKIDNAIDALMMVIDLHKPDESDFPDEWESCVECSGNGYVAMYPCQTIKVIEKEIG
jgi:hypothetical protein